MELEVVHEVLKWVCVGFMSATMVCLLIAVYVADFTDKDPTGVIYACFIFAGLVMFILLAGGAVKSELLPQCPNCEKAVASDYCPDCGWSTVEEQASVCPECGAEWDSNFCRDCGSQVMEGG